MPSTARSTAISSALSRVTFSEESTSQPLHSLLSIAGQVATRRAQLEKPILVVIGRSRHVATESHRQELAKMAEENGATLSSETIKTFGEVATSFIVAGSSASLLVVQATRV